MSSANMLKSKLFALVPCSSQYLSWDRSAATAANSGFWYWPRRMCGGLVRRQEGKTHYYRSCSCARYISHTIVTEAHERWLIGIGPTCVVLHNPLLIRLAASLMSPWTVSLRESVLARHSWQGKLVSTGHIHIAWVLKGVQMTVVRKRLEDNHKQLRLSCTI